MRARGGWNLSGPTSAQLPLLSEDAIANRRNPVNPHCLTSTPARLSLKEKFIVRPFCPTGIRGTFDLFVISVVVSVDVEQREILGGRGYAMRWTTGIAAIALLTGRALFAQPFPTPPSAPVAEVAENLQALDPSAVNLRWERQHWLLVDGERILKDFGRRESDGRQALRAIQELRLDQYGTVGTPSPLMEYWLSNGQAPQGIAPGLRRVTFDAATLRVERMQSQWCLRDAKMILFNFGFHAEEARQALAIIQKYGFTEIGVIGPAQPAMFVFLAPINGVAPNSRIAPASRVHKTAYQPEGSGRDKSRINANPGAGLGSIITPALPPLTGSAPPRHGARLAFGRESLPDRKHSAAKFGNAGSPLPGWDEKLECVPFNWRQVRMRQDNGIWELAAGNYVLCTFGADEEAARQALGVLHYYHFTEHYRIGHPRPTFSFFLINGQPPIGSMFGHSGQAFQPDKLSVQKLGMEWSLCEGDRVLAMLGDKPDEARQLLELIQQHKFDRLCRVGSLGDGGMTFLVRSR
jgi:hypothetical protein